MARAARALSMASNDPNEKAAANTSSTVQEKTCPGGDPNDPDDDEPKVQDLQKVSDRDANRVAKEQGYKDAHDAKAGRGESRVNIYRDKSTGKYYLWDGKATSARDPL